MKNSVSNKKVRIRL